MRTSHRTALRTDGGSPFRVRFFLLAILTLAGATTAYGQQVRRNQATPCFTVATLSSPGCSPARRAHTTRGVGSSIRFLRHAPCSREGPAPGKSSGASLMSTSTTDRFAAAVSGGSRQWSTRAGPLQSLWRHPLRSDPPPGPALRSSASECEADPTRMNFSPVSSVSSL